MWNKKEMNQLDATLTRVPLPLTFDLELLRSNCISGMRGPIVMEQLGQESIGCPDMKHYGNESTGCCADWGTFDLEFSRSNCISGMGGPIVMERKERGSVGCPDVRHQVKWTLHWLGYIWPWPLTLNFQGQIVSREWGAWLSWNKRIRSP